MFALLQIYPAEATVPLAGESGEAGDNCGVDVLAVDDSEERLEQFAAEYEERYRAAHQEWTLWDDIDREWDEVHDRRSEELELKYCVFSPSIGNMRWQIVEVRIPAFGPGAVRAAA